MSVSDDAYFLENVVDVNKKVKNIFIGTIFVPITFIVLTIAGLWIVPHSYSLSILLYSLSITAIYILLIKKNVNPLLLMYLGVIFSSMFVFLLSMDGIILISISYSFPPFVACLYYNKRLTRTTTVVCFLLAILSYWMRSFSVDLVTHGLFTSLQWFTRYVVGLVIEYTFLFVLTTYMSARIHNTLEKLIQSMAATDDAYSKLKERTVEIEKVNAELQETNERLDETQFKIIQFVAQCLGSHDLFTGRHVIHTQKYVEVICN